MKRAYGSIEDIQFMSRKSTTSPDYSSRVRMYQRIPRPKKAWEEEGRSHLV
jgi:hypothetical protein